MIDPTAMVAAVNEQIVCASQAIRYERRQARDPNKTERIRSFLLKVTKTPRDRRRSLLGLRREARRLL